MGYLFRKYRNNYKPNQNNLMPRDADPAFLTCHVSLVHQKILLRTQQNRQPQMIETPPR